MNLNFITDPEMAPRPRDEIRILSFGVDPYPDGRRVRLEIEITPFAPPDRPNLEIMALSPEDKTVESLSVIASMHRKLSLTMHLRHPHSSPGAYTFRAALYFEEENIQDIAETTVNINTDTEKRG